MHLHPLPAFTDNYIWILHDGARAVVVDPGESAGVQTYLADHRLALDTILITHHHGDHTGGVAALREATGARVIGPVREAMPEPLQRVAGGETIEVLSQTFEVIDVPGHTAGHIAFYAKEVAGLPLLFCGDTLFSAGCGRLFEGTPAQMLDSLTRLAALPAATRVCCTHEYTLSNLRFAQTVEPGNAALTQYRQWCDQQRAQNLPTLPSTIGLEQAVNPFLRAHQPSLAAAAQTHNPACGNDPLAVFAALREWKNVF
jgi:hydroxyacylglutathione hydrolase